ncbi:hypothetical protein GCM10009665_48900 [Kitasatospora nipponensis]|uniref:Uncharacterized protein n=1 Tax=Kitasatospora nipponensis TaxID=258049 RepID=A0ABP4H988_9ACTN
MPRGPAPTITTVRAAGGGPAGPSAGGALCEMAMAGLRGRRGRGGVRAGPDPVGVTRAASLNAAAQLSLRFGSYAEAGNGCQGRSLAPDSSRRLTKSATHCSTWAMNAAPPLVTRDHIDFGRVWSAACRG